VYYYLKGVEFMFDEKELGKNVKRIRKLMCIKSYDFAITANLNYTHLSDIENGRNIPTAKTAINILNTLNFTNTHGQARGVA